MFFVEPVKIGIITKTCCKGGFLHGDPLLDQITGINQPAQNNIFPQGHTDTRLEKMLQAVFADEKAICDLRAGYVFGKMAADVVNNILNNGILNR